ncbi:hypothetical protein BDZ45DRAFT_698490 [Acephala macrosclerotiorum]|nr:hypothetical protein BDZ45DRAFT_698490 [Acephala macrosclerotiorum]
MQLAQVEGQLQPCVILLNGFPGAGKLTIAKALQLALPPDVPSRLVDNHVLIDLSEAIEPGRTEEHYALRKKVRDVAFSALKRLKEDNTVIIMTTCLSETPVDIARYHEHADIARARGVPLFTFNLTCDNNTNEARLCNERRKAGRESGRMKLVDVDVLARIRQEYVLLDPRRTAHSDPKLFHLDLDISDLSAEEAMKRIRAFIYDPKKPGR